MSTSTLIVDIPKGEWLTANGKKGHWSTRASRAKQLRRRSYLKARSQQIPTQHGLVHITCYVHGRDNRKFDPNNAADTTKALIDGLRDAGVLTDDDYTHVLGPDHRRGEPVRTLKPGWHRITIHIEPVEKR